MLHGLAVEGTTRRRRENYCTTLFKKHRRCASNTGIDDFSRGFNSGAVNRPLRINKELKHIASGCIGGAANRGIVCPAIFSPPMRFPLGFSQHLRRSDADHTCGILAGYARVEQQGVLPLAPVFRGS